MCGAVIINGHRFDFDCEYVDPDWRDPRPVIDFTRFKFAVDSVSGPRPEPWKSELTKITEVLAVAHLFSDRDLSDRLANVVVDIGNSIAERAQVDVKFGWQV